MNEPLFQALFEEVVEVRPLTVTELNAEIKVAVEGGFEHVWVEGEIVNFRPYSSGHWYFSLNDGESQIGVNCWKSTAARIRFKPQNGMNVRIKGRITFYEPKGELKLQVESMQPAGEGSLAIAFEQIRARLEAEGLFDDALKRPLPRFPRRVGIVTSATGAAFQDIVHVLSRRAASVNILLFPTRVQGDTAAEEICSAIARANRLHTVGEAIDVLIVGRGGGSGEDLWAFNDEKLARVIRASGIPIISAVGHEIDTTIADLVADRRAATPSAAAEIVAQHEDEIRSFLDRTAVGLTGLLNHQVRSLNTSSDEAARRLHLGFATGHAQSVSRFDNIAGRISFNLIERHREKCDLRVADFERRQTSAVDLIVASRTARLEKVMAGLDALSPLRVLERGYSITQTADDRIVSTTAQVAAGDALKIRLADGKLNATVTSVE